MATKNPTVKVEARDDGTYVEVGTEVTWVRDSYTEPRESLFECDVCGQEIEDWHLWTCMDGGEAAHETCVEVI